MRVQIINVEKDDTREMPTGYCLLEEEKVCGTIGRSMKSHQYSSNWYAITSNLGEFLVGLEKHENNVISFASSEVNNVDCIIWIGVEDNPY
ncbi:hypothetical protein [Bacillus toyonensis]|uniref:hypothetical protein n=1 Tax=Bacillus toyonensis TaxID=155322 RepID=UPI00124CA614|nr:hypothetical protein [Bacillus toyonensis]KAB2380176.1 hypothetical protein F8507_27205 [Bacillus toyonensis]